MNGRDGRCERKWRERCERVEKGESEEDIVKREDVIENGQRCERVKKSVCTRKKVIVKREGEEREREDKKI